MSYFNAKQAAHYLGVSRTTFYKWKAKYQIKPLIVDGIVRYSQNSLDKFMEKQNEMV